MKAATQNATDLSYLRSLIAHMPVAMLINVPASGALVCRPTYLLEMNETGSLWLLIDRNAIAGDGLQSLTLSFSDAIRAIYVSVSGYGEIEHDAMCISHLWSVLARPWYQMNERNADLALLKFTLESAEYWDDPLNKVMRVVVVNTEPSPNGTSSLNQTARKANTIIATNNRIRDVIAWRYAKLK
jgi:general stress protein 26